MVCVQDSIGNSIVFAHPYNGVTQAILDVIPGWTSIFNGPNDNLYVQHQNLVVAAPVSIFINAGASKPLAKFI
jgi:hypothetical protein